MVSEYKESVVSLKRRLESVGEGEVETVLEDMVYESAELQQKDVLAARLTELEKLVKKAESAVKFKRRRLSKETEGAQGSHRYM